MTSRLRFFLGLWAIFFTPAGLWSQAKSDLTLKEYVDVLRKLRVFSNQRNQTGLTGVQQTAREFAPEIRVEIPGKPGEPADFLQASLSWVEPFLGRIENGEEKGDSDDFWWNSRRQRDSIQRLGDLNKTLSITLEEVSHLGDASLLEDSTDLSKILNDPRYKDKEPEGEEEESHYTYTPREPTAIEEFFEWIKDNFGYLVIWGILGVLLYYVARYGLGMSPEFGHAPKQKDFTGLLEADDPDTAAEMLEKAQGAEKQENWKGALRFRYLALILHFDETDLIPYRASYTDWEYHRMMVSLRFPEESSRPATLAFDESHYGGRPVSPDSYQQFMRHWQVLWAQAKTGGIHA